jgi:exopolyphosphatase / guanosine-5'-triphosphate,3'-diphosphate pyrophosphatase
LRGHAPRRNGLKNMALHNGLGAPRAGAGPRRPKAGHGPLFAALDLGTNNCRLLVAAPAADGFRVVDGYSQIVRLGEGLSAAGRLSDEAMARAYRAIGACAERIAWRRPAAVACVATQACRAAANGARFLDQVRRDFGLDFQVISPEEEAKLAVLGCASLMDASARRALIVDIGGGSTELSLVCPRDVAAHLAGGGLDPPITAWCTAPLGVVTLADEDPEPEADNAAWYAAMVDRLAARFTELGAANALFADFAAADSHMIGTSGTVTSLAGVHFNLRRYQRARVDGAWLSAAECRAAVAKLLSMSREDRAEHPCVGRARADLVGVGCAILDAVHRLWPTTRIRVADRGLREGLLMRLIAAHGARP